MKRGYTSLNISSIQGWSNFIIEEYCVFPLFCIALHTLYNENTKFHHTFLKSKRDNFYNNSKSKKVYIIRGFIK